jgi:hypothetical protein
VCQPGGKLQANQGSKAAHHDEILKPENKNQNKARSHRIISASKKISFDT